MTEQELLQEALMGLPRPTPPARLRRAVMAQVRQESEALSLQVWRRTEGENWAVEWRQGGAFQASEPLPDSTGPASATFTQWRHQEGNRVTIYEMTQTLTQTH